MKIMFTSFFVVFYSLGTIFLPMSDFGILGEMTSIFENCKTTEADDLAAIVFFTDQLLDFDCMIDNSQNKKGQNPHKPIKHNRYRIFPRMLPEGHCFEVQNEDSIGYSKNDIVDSCNVLYSFKVVFSIFHPPIIA